jgi:acyl-CoA reductase-like NAD-dependent aldehyde dehydrogenase
MAELRRGEDETASEDEYPCVAKKQEGPVCPSKKQGGAIMDKQTAVMEKLGFATVNPSTEAEIETFSFFNPVQTEEVVARADKSFQSFRKLSVHKRAELFSNLASTLRKNKAQLAKVITTEMGKVFVEAEAEVDKCTREADWYAEHGPQIMADEPAPTGAVNAYVSYLPLGPILAIMPWNFPIWQLTRMAIPTMLAGNVVLVKHSPNTQRSSLEFERIMLQAGFPEGVFQNLILNTDDIVNVINDARVQGASVTGSVRAGSAVASEAGKVIKKTVMELGGSDAFIVCEDADIPKAVAAGIRGRFQNAGQVCLAAKRFILVGKIADEFERSFVDAAKSLRVGDPFESSTDLGPLARADLRDSLQKQVEGSIAKGARLLCGGKPVDGKGAFYPPTVLSGVTEGMPAFDEETFGPVAALTRVPDVDSAVLAANASQFGLSGSLWTRDIDLARKVARDLYTGGVFINGVTASDPRVPVGGVKNSGYGRELSHFGAHAFVNAQTVWIENA